MPEEAGAQDRAGLSRQRVEPDGLGIRSGPQNRALGVVRGSWVEVLGHRPLSAKPSTKCTLKTEQAAFEDGAGGN